MDTSRERDQSVERLLRQSLRTPRPGGVTDACLDAEALAAWVDGGLSGAALEIAQSHVADCARCQSLVGAMARANTLVPPLVRQPEPDRPTRRWLAWLVPLTAAALAVAVWVAVPRDLNDPPAPARPDADVQRKETNQPQAPAAAKEPQEMKAARDRVERQASAPELRKDAGQLEADSLKKQDAAPPAAQETFTARPANALAQACGASGDALPTEIIAQLTASAAPSTSVCWVVGRGGVVLLSIDGRSWRRVAFPEITDLSAVQATDARTASVTTADGRTFSTSDGGMTWVRR